MAEAEAMAEAMATAEPETHSVEIPVGSSDQGCKESSSCYSPQNITINAGDAIEWMNTDTLPHTATSGSAAGGGPSEVFNSDLLMADDSYAFTFENTGSYDYFCIVHPWMVGSVTVN
jgi:plastocyanin